MNSLAKISNKMRAWLSGAELKFLQGHGLRPVT